MTLDDIIYTLDILGGLVILAGIWVVVSLVLAVRREIRRDTYRGGPPPQAR
jgi:hypothetical protein